MKTREPTPQEIDELVSFLPRLYAEDVAAIERWDGGTQSEDRISTIPWPKYREVVREFFRLASGECWSDYDYRAEKAGQMLENDEFMKAADLGEHNQVLVASRYPLELGEIRGPATANRGGESNFLHVRVQREGIEFVGLRTPSYTGAALMEYWVGLVNIIQACAVRRIVFMGATSTLTPNKRVAARRSTFMSSRVQVGWCPHLMVSGVSSPKRDSGVELITPSFRPRFM